MDDPDTMADAMWDDPLSGTAEEVSKSAHFAAQAVEQTLLEDEIEALARVIKTMGKSEDEEVAKKTLRNAIGYRKRRINKIKERLDRGRVEFEDFPMQEALKMQVRRPLLRAAGVQKIQKMLPEMIQLDDYDTGDFFS